MKTLHIALALLLTAKLGAADAPKVFAPPQSLSVPSSFTVSGTLSFSVGLSSHQDPDGQFRVFHSTREPIVTKTADGWVITFREQPKMDEFIPPLPYTIRFDGKQYAVFFYDSAWPDRYATKQQAIADLIQTLEGRKLREQQRLKDLVQFNQIVAQPAPATTASKSGAQAVPIEKLPIK